MNDRQVFSNMNKMEELSNAILLEGILKENFHDDDLKKRLAEFPPLEFIPHFLLKNSISFNDIFFLSNLSYWESLNYIDWKELLVKISHRGLGVYSFFVITYKFLKVNLIPFYLDLKSNYEDLKIGSLRRFYENPHILQHDDEADELINMYSLDGVCLIRIRNKLLSQGALEAEWVEPREKIGLGLGYTKVEPPSSWQEWFRELS